MALVVVLCGHAIAREPVAIIMPEAENLQDLPFFIALGAGYFSDEGLDITIKVPDSPNEVFKLLHGDADQVAVLPPPIYLQLIADRFPLLIVANLLRNDAINLVVRKSLIASRRLPLDAPLAARLRALAGTRLGVAPGPSARLRVLYRSQGLDADKLLTIVPLMGPEQNDAFAAGKVDALYAHTPFLERALVDEEAVLYVNQSSGEVAELAGRTIHTLAVTKAMAQHRPDVVRRLVRAIARAETLAQRDGKATEAAIARALPSRPAALVARVTALYRPAVPPTPEVTADSVRAAQLFSPAGKRAPDLTGIDFAPFVDDRFARAAMK